VANQEPEDDELEETLVVTIVDEDGEEEEFALLDMIEVDGKRYGLFAPADELEESEEGTEAEEEGDEEAEGILVLRAVQRGAEEDFEMIEDEDEFTKVLDHLEKMASATQLNFGTSVNNN
jgi:uncharacterized protein YrzB (UPF0473 family)